MLLKKSAYELTSIIILLFLLATTKDTMLEITRIRNATDLRI